MRFIKLKEKIVSVDSIVTVDTPRKYGAIEWGIRTVLDSTKSSEGVINSVYTTEEEAKQEYSRIVEQLCSDKV